MLHLLPIAGLLEYIHGQLISARIAQKKGDFPGKAALFYSSLRRSKNVIRYRGMPMSKKTRNANGSVDEQNCDTETLLLFLSILALLLFTVLNPL